MSKNFKLNRKGHKEIVIGKDNAKKFLSGLLLASVTIAPLAATAAIAGKQLVPPPITVKPVIESSEESVSLEYLMPTEVVDGEKILNDDAKVKYSFKADEINTIVINTTEGPIIWYYEYNGNLIKDYTIQNFVNYGLIDSNQECRLIGNHTNFDSLLAPTFSTKIYTKDGEEFISVFYDTNNEIYTVSGDADKINNITGVVSKVLEYPSLEYNDLWNLEGSEIASAADSAINGDTVIVNDYLPSNIQGFYNTSTNEILNIDPTLLGDINFAENLLQNKDIVVIFGNGEANTLDDVSCFMSGDEFKSLLENNQSEKEKNR